MRMRGIDSGVRFGLSYAYAEGRGNGACGFRSAVIAGRGGLGQAVASEGSLRSNESLRGMMMADLLVVCVAVILSA